MDSYEGAERLSSLAKQNNVEIEVRLEVDTGLRRTGVQPLVSPLNLKGFGHIVNLQEAVLERLTEEHEMIRVPEDHDLKIGDTLEIIPNHICSTVILHNDVYIKDEKGELERYAVEARGKVQ